MMPKHIASPIRAVLPALLALGLLALPAQAQQLYKMSTLGPGTTPYVVSTTMAQLANKHAGIEMQVNATGTATRHAVDAAQGKIDFFMSAPIVHHFMQNQLAMYKNMDQAPELSRNLRTIFNFPIGVYHMVVYADSDITDVEQIKGRRVFLGPPTGAARVIGAALVEGTTGYKAGEDFEEVSLGWSAAAQAFQDRQVDLYINPTNVPSSVISQIALTNKIRILGLSDADLETPRIRNMLQLPGRTLETIPPDGYGNNQVNTRPVRSVGAWVGMGTHKDVPADVIYEVVKAFYEHPDERRAQAKWMDAVHLGNAMTELNMTLHPGAARYFQEKGVEIPDEYNPLM